ncbi:hypothetical protein pb186bvf_011113 [Paramecium bursaria]
MMNQEFESIFKTVNGIFDTHKECQADLKMVEFQLEAILEKFKRNLIPVHYEHEIANCIVKVRQSVIILQMRDLDDRLQLKYGSFEVSRKLKKVTKSKSFNLLLDQQMKNKKKAELIQKQIRNSYEQLTKLEGQFNEIEFLPFVSKQSDLEDLSVTRLIQIYDNEVNHLMEFVQIMNDYEDQLKVQAVIKNRSIQWIVSYYKEYLQIQQFIVDYISLVKSIYEQSDKTDSTNIENSFSEGMGDESNEYIQSVEFSRSKSRTIEIDDKERRVFQEIVNREHEEPKSCVQCTIF